MQRIWAEARKALEATALTDHQRAYRYHTLMFERDLENDARTVLGEERRRRVATTRTPFRSLPAEELTERGYVRPDPDGDTYYGPDAGVLLSAPFLDTHCFRLERAEVGDAVGLLGLTFEPLDSRDEIVDISGTLWLDRATSELRWLDYRYVNLDPDVRSDHVGGRVEFRRMPDGGWIVPEWVIRMPRVAVQRTTQGWARTYVAGYRETGGMVLDVEGVGAEPRARTGTIEGLVADSLGEPVSGARVQIVGTDRWVHTDPRGRYRFRDLVGGTYRVAFEDTRLRAFGHSPEPVAATVARGRTTELGFQMPSAASVLAEVCDAHDPGIDPARLPIQAFGGGVLAGQVLDATTGGPLPGAEVRVTTHRYEFRRGTHPLGSLPIYSSASVGSLPPHETRLQVFDETFGLVTRADADGYFRVCHVPEIELLEVVAVHEGIVTEADTLKIAEYGGVLEHTLVVPRIR